jgi:hypothetical protein
MERRDCVICSLDDELGGSSTYMEDVPLVLLLCSFLSTGRFYTSIVRLVTLTEEFLARSQDLYGQSRRRQSSHFIGFIYPFFGFYHLVLGCM